MYEHTSEYLWTPLFLLYELQVTDNKWIFQFYAILRLKMKFFVFCGQIDHLDESGRDHFFEKSGQS